MNNCLFHSYFGTLSVLPKVQSLWFVLSVFHVIFSREICLILMRLLYFIYNVLRWKVKIITHLIRTVKQLVLRILAALSGLVFTWYFMEICAIGMRSFLFKKCTVLSNTWCLGSEQLYLVWFLPDILWKSVQLEWGCFYFESAIYLMVIQFEQLLIS